MTSKEFVKMLKNVIELVEDEPEVKPQPRIVANNLTNTQCVKCNEMFKAGEAIYFTQSGVYAHAKCPVNETVQKPSAKPTGVS